MDFLNTALKQLSDLFRSMTMGARLTAGLLLAVVVVSLMYLFNHQMTSTDGYLLGGQSFSANELPAVEAALAQAGLNGYQLEGNRIRIPQHQQAAYVAALAEGQALPTNWGDYLQHAVESDNPFTTAREREERLKIARQQELSLILRSMKEVENAAVHYDSQKRSGFGEQRTATASVSIKLVGGRLLDDQRVQLIRHLVAGAFADLSPERVTVADLSSGRVHSPTTEDGIGNGHDHRYLATMEAFQRQVEQRVVNALSYVPGVVVSANVELDNQLRRSVESIKHDPKTVAVNVREESTTSRSEAPTRGGPPGLNAQQPNQPARVTESTSRGANSEEEQSSREEQNVVNSDRTVSEEIGLIPKRVTVSVGIPSTYFENIWRERHPQPADQPPKEAPAAELAQIESEEKTNIRNHVAVLIPKPADMIDPTPLVTVTKFQHLATAELPAPGGSQQALAWLGDHWSTLGMIGLALFSLLVLRSMIRSAAAETPAPAAALSGSTATAAAAEVSGEAELAAAATAATGGEPTGARSRLKRKVSSGSSLREDLAAMVKEDPDAAANILRTWISSAT